MAIVGAGIAARKLHNQGLDRLKDRITVAAVVNHNIEKAYALAEYYGVDRADCYADYRDVLARDDIEAVDLVLPYHLNLEVSEASARAGKHVICEKPVANTLEEADRFCELAERYGVVVLIAENVRYNPSIVKARELIGAGRIGMPHLAIYHRIQYLEGDFASTAWRFDPVLNPMGFILDGGVHFVHVLRMLLGDVAAVSAMGRDVRDGFPGGDAMVMNLRHTGGGPSTLACSWSSHPVGDGAHLTIYGDTGTLEVIRNTAVVFHPRGGGQEETHPVENDNGYYGEFLDFAEAIREGKPVQVPPASARHDLAIIQAAFDSVRTGKEAKVQRGGA